MGSLFSRMFRTPSVTVGATPEAYRVLSQSAGSPSASGTGGEDIRLERAEDRDMVRVFVAVLRDERDTARDTIRDMSPRDRALLSFHLEEVTRLVSEEEDFRRGTDRRAARLSAERRESASLEDIVEGHLRDI